MKNGLLHIILLLCMLCWSCVACTDDTGPSSTPASDGQLSIVYRIAGAASTRATELGWDGEWNENAVTHLDLFVFNKENGDLYRHIPFPNPTSADTPLTTDRLTYSEVKSGNYIYYMVANCLQLGTAGINSLTDLQEEMIAPDLIYNKRQETFVMDAKIEKTPQEDETTKTITLSFALARAAVKIRLAVQDNSKNSIIDNCTYQLVNYVSTGTSVLAEAEKYGEGTEQERKSMPQSTKPELIYDEKKVVFYSYPNDWFDENLLNEEGTFIDDAIYAKDDLIDENKQTYILLNYKDNQFKVPVNFTISKDNDKVVFTKEDIEKLRDDYYRMLRNHIYDVTVTIDITTEEITLQDIKILVNAWNEKGNMDVIFGTEEEGQ